MTRATLDILLLALLGSDETVHSWWLSNNKAFDDNYPAFIYETDPKRVEDYVRGQFR